MGLLSALKSMFGSKQTRQPQETYRYKCRKCNVRFQSHQRHVTDESCPQCGADDVRPDVQFE